MFEVAFPLLQLAPRDLYCGIDVREFENPDSDGGHDGSDDAVTVRTFVQWWSRCADSTPQHCTRRLMASMRR